MKEYFKFFKIPLILVVILTVVTVVISAVVGSDSTADAGRTNSECTTTERVFDQADVLTDAEEDSLRELIAVKEKEAGCDIVVVTLNESLVEYAAGYADQIGSVTTDKCVMVYADNFYEEHKFGYNAPYGDGVLLLDNWYREDDGKIYSWMTASGRAMEHYDTSMAEEELDACLENVDSDPYGAYASFVEDVAFEMGGGIVSGILSLPIVFAVSLIVAGIFMAVNWSGKKGKCTVDERTYVAGGKPDLKHTADTFLYKNVVKRHIETNSGGGGGGHTSAGGNSFSGGGHSR